MLFSAPIGFRIQKIILGLLVLITFLLVRPSLVHAYEISPTQPPLTQFSDSLAPDVPRNQHTFVQSLFIETAAALICQLVGVDPINTKMACLGVDSVSHKISYVQPTDASHSTLGGALGFATGMISRMYIPPARSSEYFQNLADNFGIVKKTYAATDGLHSLSPILGIWKTFRDISYLVFVLAFIFIGLGIMLRIKIDPRTVMTIQNQIPRVIVSILLITFSFAISGFMIDLMWLSTYVGINVITSSPGTNPFIRAGISDTPTPLSQRATQNLYWTPVSYVNFIFNDGLAGLTNNISGAMGNLIGTVISQSIGSGECKVGLAPFTIDVSGCIGGFIGGIAHYILWIIIFLVLIVALFRIWFELLKAYMFILMYIVLAPLWIVAGLLPGRPLGFGNWMRSLFVNLAVFPATAFLFVFSSVIAGLLNANPNPDLSFIPPLTGNPNMRGSSDLSAGLPTYGYLGTLGMILMGPTLLTILRESLKVPGTKHGAAIAQGLAAGAAAPAAFSNKVWGNLTRVNSNTGEATGLISAPMQRFQSKIMKSVPFVGRRMWEASARNNPANRNIQVNSFQEDAADRLRQRVNQGDPGAIAQATRRAERSGTATRIPPNRPQGGGQGGGGNRNP
jgi:hypothetical protein